MDEAIKSGPLLNGIEFRRAKIGGRRRVSFVTHPFFILSVQLSLSIAALHSSHDRENRLPALSLSLFTHLSFPAVCERPSYPTDTQSSDLLADYSWKNLSAAKKMRVEPHAILRSTIKRRPPARPSDRQMVAIRALARARVQQQKLSESFFLYGSLRPAGRPTSQHSVSHSQRRAGGGHRL